MYASTNTRHEEMPSPEPKTDPHGDSFLCFHFQGGYLSLSKKDVLSLITELPAALERMGQMENEWAQKKHEEEML